MRSRHALQLYHIHTDGQRSQAQQTVEQLVVLVHAQLDGLRQVGLQCDDFLKVVPVVIAVIGVVGEAAVALHAEDTHRHLRDAPHVGELDVVPLSRGYHLLLHVGTELQGGELFLPVAQLVCAFPLAPALDGQVQIGHLLFCSSVGQALHKRETLEGCLATGIKVAEAVDEAVEPLQVGRVVQRFHLAGALLPYQLDAGQQLGHPVSGRGIVVAQHVETPRLIAYHRQQVVVEELTVAAHFDDGGILLSLSGGQQVGMLQRPVVIFLGNLLMAVLVELAVGFIHIAQHGAVDGPQHTVLGLLLTHLEPLHGRLQRVGAHRAHRPRFLQLSLQ